MNRRPDLRPLADRGPLRVMFVTCSMPVGGSEVLLTQLIRGMDRERFQPELCCLKSLGPLGESLVDVAPTHCWLWKNKWDPTIVFRLSRLFRQRRIDAVVTVGAGDKMFWGRLAAWRCRIPVIASALHSTGWPDRIERLNRWLTPITDAFIGVAPSHGRHLIEDERFPEAKVRVIPNGVDVRRFRPLPGGRASRRAALGIEPSAPVCGVVAALRPEKNLQLFLQAAAEVHRQLPAARFLIIGDGPERATLEQEVDRLQLRSVVQLLGARRDIPELLSAMDLFALCSDNEANPVSILEAMSVGLPVVATRVGSIADVVREGLSGLLTTPGDVAAQAEAWLQVLAQPARGAQMGRVGRQVVVTRWSVDRMIGGYERLLSDIYAAKCRLPDAPDVSSARPAAVAEPPADHAQPVAQVGDQAEPVEPVEPQPMR